QRETVAKDADDERPEQGPQDVAPAAEEAGASEDHRGDAVEVVGLARLWIADSRARDQQQARDAVDEAGERIDGEQHPRVVDAHQPGRLCVVAERVDVPPRRGIAQDEPGGWSTDPPTVRSAMYAGRAKR